jgi:hypothetical protein
MLSCLSHQAGNSLAVPHAGQLRLLAGVHANTLPAQAMVHTHMPVVWRTCELCFSLCAAQSVVFTLCFSHMRAPPAGPGPCCHPLQGGVHGLPLHCCHAHQQDLTHHQHTRGLPPALSQAACCPGVSLAQHSAQLCPTASKASVRLCCALQHLLLHEKRDVPPLMISQVAATSFNCTCGVMA